MSDKMRYQKVIKISAGIASMIALGAFVYNRKLPTDKKKFSEKQEKMAAVIGLGSLVLFLQADNL